MTILNVALCGSRFVRLFVFFFILTSCCHLFDELNFIGFTVNDKTVNVRGSCA